MTPDKRHIPKGVIQLHKTMKTWLLRQLGHINFQWTFHVDKSKHDDMSPLAPMMPEKMSKHQLTQQIDPSAINFYEGYVCRVPVS